MARQTHQLGRPRSRCCGRPSRCSEVDRDRSTHPCHPGVRRSGHLDRLGNRATTKGALVTLLPTCSRPIGVVESTSSIKKVLTNAQEHHSIHSLERTAFTHWMTEKFVKQATDRPLATLINEVGKGGWYE